jgi:hypothetical protein
MEDKIEGSNELNSLFKSILGTEINIKDNIDATEELLFKNTIQGLEDSRILEDKLYEDYGIQINTITDPLWSVIENDFTYLYGDSAKETIMFYLFDRLNEDGEVKPLNFDDGKVFTLNNVDDLWSYIKYKAK